MAADGMDFGGAFGKTAQIAAERALLAALLVRPSNFDALPDAFSREYFSDGDHGDIFEVAKKAAAGGAPYLAPAIETALEHLGKYVREVASSVMGSTAADAKLYAQTLMRLEDRRRLIEIADLIKGAAVKSEDLGDPTALIAARAMERLDCLLTAQKASRGAISLSQAMANAIQLGEDTYRRGDGLAGVTTGFRCLNRRMKGYLKGTMHILAARPGVGKTALALAIAIAAARAGNKVLYISLEMEAEQLAQRALALLADVSAEEIMMGSFARENSVKATAQAERLLRAQQDMAGIVLDIEDEPALTAAAIKMRIKAAERRHGRVDMVIVDHLHIMGHSDAGRRHGAVQANTENSNALLAASKEFGVALLALAQLSRNVESRDDKRPIMPDLRESGAIEQDAFSVTFLYREAYYAARESEEDRPGDTPQKKADRIARLQAAAQNNEAELIVAKLRMGKPGTERVLFDGPRTRFYEAEDWA